MAAAMEDAARRATASGKRLLTRRGLLSLALGGAGHVGPAPFVQTLRTELSLAGVPAAQVFTLEMP